MTPSSRKPSPSDAPPIIDARILRRIIDASDYTPVTFLARDLQMSRERVHKELDRLREAGCRFESHPQRGLRLVESGLGAWVDYLKTYAKMRLVEVYRETASTQDRARALVESLGRQAHNSVVIADHQTAGRGRLGRRWVAPPGSCVTFTLIRIGKIDDPEMSVDRLMLASGVGVASALAHHFEWRDVAMRLKWPNDLLIGNQKLAGVLVETFTHERMLAVLIGVGVNVELTAEQIDDPALRDRVTSLAMNGVNIDRLPVIDSLLQRIKFYLDSVPGPMVAAEWCRHSNDIGRRATLEHDGRRISGEVIDIDPYAGLIVRTNSGAIVHLPAATTTVIA